MNISWKDNDKNSKFRQINEWRIRRKSAFVCISPMWNKHRKNVLFLILTIQPLFSNDDWEKSVSVPHKELQIVKHSVIVKKLVIVCIVTMNSTDNNQKKEKSNRHLYFLTQILGLNFLSYIIFFLVENLTLTN